MVSRAAAGMCWLFLVLLCSPALASPSEAVDLAARWRVQADGWSGTLELQVEPSGRVYGTLQGRTVTGFVAGRRFVFRRTIGHQTEVWDGWLPEDPGSSSLFIAGTVTVGGRDGGRVRPWYGVPEPGPRAGDSPGKSAAVRAAPEPEKSATPEPARVSATSAPVPAGDAPPPADVPTRGAAVPSGEDVPPPTEASAKDPGVIRPQASGPSGWDLSGIWITSDGRSEIFQQGRRLSIVLPDGTRHAGRFTGPDVVVVGLRKGCCKGDLQGPNMIQWSDGAVWQRAD